MGPPDGLIWPVVSSAFGEAEIDAVVEHFSQVLSNPEKIGDRWTMLKARIFMEHKSFEKLTWASVGPVHGSTCPDTMNLIELIQVMPVATADYERGFIVMKRVKSDWRSRLNQTHTVRPATCITDFTRYTRLCP